MAITDNTGQLIPPVIRPQPLIPPVAQPAINYIPPQVSQLANMGDGGYFESQGNPESTWQAPPQIPLYSGSYAPTPQLQQSNNAAQPAYMWNSSTMPNSGSPSPTPPTAAPVQTGSPAPSPGQTPTATPSPTAAPTTAPAAAPAPTAAPAPAPWATNPAINPNFDYTTDKMYADEGVLTTAQQEYMKNRPGGAPVNVPFVPPTTPSSSPSPPASTAPNYGAGVNLTPRPPPNPAITPQPVQGLVAAKPMPVTTMAPTNMTTITSTAPTAPNQAHPVRVVYPQTPPQVTALSRSPAPIAPRVIPR